MLLAIIVLASVIPLPSPAKAADSQLPHYLIVNRSRYEEYGARNPGMPFDKVVAYVNANVDLGFYSDITTVENPADINLLLNKNFALPMEYEPTDLVTMSDGKMLRSEAAAAFTELRNAGRNAGLTFVIRSAYRSYWAQRTTHSDFLARFSRESAERQSARPRHSEHELGLAVDVLQRYVSGALGSAHFESSREYAWLLEHGHEFGFILRYPSDMRDIHGYIYEPWHWRYVGTEIATAMFIEGISTFEEYYGRYLAPGVVAKQERERLEREERERARMVLPAPVGLDVFGDSFTVQTYLIENSNFIRLRDIAFILNGTDSQIALDYDSRANEIAVTSGRPYSPNGVELSGVPGELDSEIQTVTSMRINGALHSFEAYLVDGCNFIRLRDLGDALGLSISWDQAGRVIKIAQLSLSQ